MKITAISIFKFLILFRAVAEVNGQTIEFDIYESLEFAEEFIFIYKSDAYILLADPIQFSATEYATTLQNILKYVIIL